MASSTWCWNSKPVLWRILTRKPQLLNSVLHTSAYDSLSRLFFKRGREREPIIAPFICAALSNCIFQAQPPCYHQHSKNFKLFSQLSDILHLNKNMATAERQAYYPQKSWFREYWFHKRSKKAIVKQIRI